MTADDTYSPVVDTRIPLDSPQYLSDEEYKEKALLFISQMNQMSFEDVLNMLQKI